MIKSLVEIALSDNCKIVLMLKM